MTCKGNFRGFDPAKRVEFELERPDFFRLLPKLIALGKAMGLDAPPAHGAAPTRGCIVGCQLVNGDVCIGRGTAWYPRSKWANPFVARSAADLPRVLARYRRYLHENGELMNSLHELSGKRLVCHCTPHARCHADVLIEAFREQLV